MENDSNKDKEAEKDSRNSGVGDGTTTTPTMASSGKAAVLGIKNMASTTGGGALPLPGTLAPMTILRSLTDDLEKYSERCSKI